MATPSEYERKQRRNIAALQARIDRIFRKAAEEAARIGISIRDLPDDRIFSFDDYPKTLKQVERLLDALHSSVQATVTDGIRLGWSLADDKNDALVRRVFGKGADSLTPAQQQIYLARNADALEAFIARKTAGLNLSDRVWRYTNAFRSEIEMGLDLGIRSGLPASQMARELKKYLQYPDKLFRRVRDKHGMLKLSKAAAAFHPGRGVYRSSYKNARRLAATETNIAYRTADHERWQQLDFVVGIEVKMSGNHTCLGRDGKMHELTDICDDLAGKYPKNFKFTGWHPLCRCFATPIMKTDKEMAEENRRILRGEEPLPSSDSVNCVKEYPPAFKEWVGKNAGRIEAAEQRGKLPYFIADNKRTVDRILGRVPSMTPLEAAAQRHANRTAEQSSAIQQRWNDRRISMLDAAVANGLLPKECSKAIASLRSLNLAGKFDEIGGRIKTLQNAALRHQGRPQSQIDRIQDAWDAKLRRDETTRLVARNVLKTAQGWQEVDFSRLEQLVKDNRLGAMGAETKNVAQAIKAMRDKENALKDLIPDVHALHGKYTLAELADAHKSIRDTLDFWKTKYGADLATDSNLAKLKSELELKIKFVANPGAFKAGAVQKKTWQVQQDAYAKLLEKVETRIEFTTVINPKYEELLKFKTTSKDFNNYMAKVKAAIDAGDAATAKHFLSSAETRKKSLEFKRKRKAKTTSTQFGDDAYSKKRKDAAMWAKDPKDADDRLRTKCGEVWRTASKSQRDAIQGYTNEYHNINEPLRGLPYIGSKAKAARGLKRIPEITDIINKSSYDFDMWLQRGDGMIALKKFGLSNWQTATDADIMGLLGKEGIEGAFWSAGTAKGKGFTGKDIIFNIYAPRGTKAMYCEPFSSYGNGSGRYWDGIAKQTSFSSESEILIQRGTKYKITKIEKNGGTWYIDVDIVEQNPLPFPYVGGYPYL